MDVRAELAAECPAARLYQYVVDLASYPQWNDAVHRVEPEGDGVWNVELRARVGALARSKRLRMQRTRRDDRQFTVTFERAEADGRTHAPWVLHADIDEQAGVSTLRMHLHYGGALWTGGLLERMLTDQISRGRERLVALATSTP